MLTIVSPVLGTTGDRGRGKDREMESDQPTGVNEIGAIMPDQNGGLTPNPISLDVYNANGQKLFPITRMIPAINGDQSDDPAP